MTYPKLIQEQQQGEREQGEEEDEEQVNFILYPIPYPPIININNQIESIPIQIINKQIPSTIPTSPSTPINKDKTKILTSDSFKPFKSPQFINKQQNDISSSSSSLTSLTSARNNNLIKPPERTLNLALPNLFSRITPSISTTSTSTNTTTTGRVIGTPSNLNRSTSKRKLDFGSSSSTTTTSNSITQIQKKSKRLPFSPPSFLYSSSSPPSPSTPTTSSTVSNFKTASNNTRIQIPSIELTSLERRLILLKQARKYQSAELDDIGDDLEEEGEQRGARGRSKIKLDSERKLKALNQKWKEVGKAAIELLWDHAATHSSLNAQSNPFFLSTNNQSNGRNNTTSWGFSPSSPPSNPLTSYSSSSNYQNNDISNSWGWSSTSSFSASSFDNFESPSTYYDYEAGGKRHMGGQDDDADDEREEEEDFPSIDKVWEGINAKIEKRKVVKPEVEEEVEEDNDEDDDELMKDLEELCRGVERSDREEEDIVKVNPEGEEIGGEVSMEEKMTVGKFMSKVVGIDPKLFGWDEEEEDFI